MFIYAAIFVVIILFGQNECRFEGQNDNDLKRTLEKEIQDTEMALNMINQLPMEQQNYGSINRYKQRFIQTDRSYRQMHSQWNSLSHESRKQQLTTIFETTNTELNNIMMELTNRASQIHIAHNRVKSEVIVVDRVSKQYEQTAVNNNFHNVYNQFNG